MASGRVVRKKLADGSIKESRYDRHTRRAANAAGTMGALKEAYLRSPEWAAKRPTTKSHYLIY
jgi:hypothetical protein